MNVRDAKTLRTAPLQTRSDLKPNAVRDVSGALNILLAVAVVALYGFGLAGAWRWIYIGCATAALYLDCFVGVVQAFQKLPFLQPLQGQPPFVVAQVAVLVLFVALGILAAIRFHPRTEARA